jgi:hypothetical protein
LPSSDLLFSFNRFGSLSSTRSGCRCGLFITAHGCWSESLVPGSFKKLVHPNHTSYDISK